MQFDRMLGAWLERLRRARVLTRNIAFQNRSLFDRPHGVSVRAIEDKRGRHLGELNNGENCSAIDERNFGAGPCPLQGL